MLENILLRIRQELLGRRKISRITIPLFFIWIVACSAPIAQQTTNQPQFGKTFAEEDQSGHRDEEHGLDPKYHYGPDKTLTNIYYQKGVRSFFQIPMDLSVQWSQLGPQAATVNTYLADNGQMPGPNTGAVIDIAIDPSGTSDEIIYVISNDGGVWKTIDGGATWKPLTDNLKTLSFGAVALDPGNPQTVYAGTGSIPNNGYFKGIGVYRSTDGGATWTLTAGSSVLNGIGINKMLVPSSGTLLVATNQGMYRSTDSGATFTQISMGSNSGLYVTDLDMNPGTTTPIWASVWGKGIYVSTDQGATFSINSNLWGNGPTGAPAQDSYEFVSLGVSADGTTMYANAAAYKDPSGNTKNLTLWTSTNRGHTWSNITSNTEKAGNFARGKNIIPSWRQIQECQCGYDQTLGVDPNDSNRIYMGFQDLWLSTDGGNTWTDVTYDSIYQNELMHVDHHALVFSPPSHQEGTAPTPLWVGNDGGTWSSADGISWTNQNGSNKNGVNGFRATNLFRGIATGLGSQDNQWTYGGMQDTGTAAGGADGNSWVEWLGGDGGQVAVDPTDGKLAYGMWGALYNTNDGGKTYNLSNTTCANGTPGGYPGFTDIAVGPDRIVYATGSCVAGESTYYYIFNSTDNGANYSSLVSLTTGVTNIAISAADNNTIWLGMSNGQIAKVVKGNGSPTVNYYTIPNIPYAEPVVSLAVDPTTSSTVVAVFAGYSGVMNSSRHVFLTTDGGANWSDISGSNAGFSVPDVPIYAAAIDSNTTPHSVLVATDHGILRTLNNGTTWYQLGSGLPNVHAIDLAIDTTVNPSLLKVGTYGRSVWQAVLKPEVLITPMSTNLMQVGNVTWQNNSSEPLALSSVDLNGQEVTFATLAPNSSTTYGPAYYMGVNIVRDQTKNIVLAYTINGNSTDQIVQITNEAVAAAKANG
ncbi:MAG: hypothetical protein HYU84_16050, partial [Chloroflexi bacterium]|nr:hypothetical protein [Chloroflexota bacterium]